MAQADCLSCGRLQAAPNLAPLRKGSCPTQVCTQVWRRTWPPASKGHSVTRTRSAVHSGFLRSWTANGLCDRVLQRIAGVLADQPDKRAVQVLEPTSAAAQRTQRTCQGSAVWRPATCESWHAQCS